MIAQRLASVALVVCCTTACARFGFDQPASDSRAPDTSVDQFVPPDFGDANCTPAGWCFEAPPLLNLSLNAVWGSAADNVYAVGRNGLVLRFDGSAWREVSEAKVTTNNLLAIWGTAKDDIWSVGAFGTIVHFDGTRWSVVASPDTLDTLRGVWAAARDNVFAVGDRGTVTHYDGVQWRAAQQTPNRLNAVWGRNRDDVWAVGEAGTVLHYDGKAWSTIPQSGVLTLTGVHGASSGALFVVAGGGSTVLHYESNTFKARSSGVTARLNSVWAVDERQAYAVGAGGTIVAWDGTSWTQQASGTTSRLTAIWAAAARLHTVGADGTLLFRRR